MLRTLATRIGSHPRRTLVAALLFVIVAGAIGAPVTGMLKSSGGFAPGSSDSQVATHLLARATGTEPSPGIVLLVRTPDGARSAASRQHVATVRDRLAAVPGVARAVGPAAVSRDGRAELVTGTLSSSADDHDVATATEAAFKSDRDVVVGGSAVAGEQIGSTVSKDLGRAELLAFPLLLILSLLFFRGRATLMPLVTGITTVLGTFLVLRGVNSFYGLSTYALNLVIGMGLGLAVDYTLFIVTRYRQELAGGASEREALLTTITRAGSTVCFSAVTVACALATLVVFPEGFLKSMGIAGAIVALVAAACALTISPALLALWGANVAKGRAAHAGSASGTWYRLSRWVMRRPGPIAAVTALVMLAAAAPALSVHWSSNDDSRVIPTSQSARTVADASAHRFPGAGTQPLTIAIAAPQSSAPAVASVASRVSAMHGIERVSPPRYLGPRTWRIEAQLSGDQTGSRAQRDVTTIRALPAPFDVHVTGQAAEFVDQQAAISSHLPIVLGLLAVLTFAVLWLMTDSIVLPLKAIAMNVLTVGAALTSVVVVFQHGNLSGLLGYTPDGGVETTSFVIAAALVFALSTDYGVFLLGRIKEQRDAGLSDREAVATGLGATGRVVSAAAILLAVAIGAFSTSQISFIQQIGIAVVAGVLIDAFVVRALLVPSLMGLLGAWNWWSPRWLHRLHGVLAPAEARGGRRRGEPALSAAG
ncbi:MAG TPA: MMPL family transporter [Solirubrobacteraceae bacterium]|nr:MMPL family transporter [Solirubrobacteraceae bacterium]